MVQAVCWQVCCSGRDGFPENQASWALQDSWGVLLLVGPLLDTCTVFLAPISMNWGSILTIYISGFTVNISQGLSTFLVLFLLGNPMLEKLDRIKVKYGMMEGENGI